MANTNMLETTTTNLTGILGNGKIYKVPPYQRDYSWREEHWEDLWNDILNILNSGDVHFMGPIVIQAPATGEVYTIIDGQQRLATLSIAALAILKNIHDLVENNPGDDKNKERMDLLRSQFLGAKDPASLTYSSKLFLNENNDSFYQRNLLQLQPPVNPRKLNDSELLLWQAFEFFYSRIKNYLAENLNGESLARLLTDTLGKRLSFILISTPDELSANEVYKSFNANRTFLSVPDLLKKHLFSLVSPNDLRHIKDQWKHIIMLIGINHFPTFLQCYWNSRYEFSTIENLFEKVRSAIGNAKDVFQLLNELEKACYIYSALSNPLDDFWQNDRKLKKAVGELSLFGISLPYPLLLAANEMFQPEEFLKILKYCVVISFRFNVIANLNANRMENAYHKAALNVSNGNSTNAREVFKDLKEIYLPDEQFENAFQHKTIPTGSSDKNIVRYILFEIENQFAGTARDFEDDSATIEHILPEKPLEAWDRAFPPLIQSASVFKLGNYTLLEAAKNRDCGTKPFHEKKEFYKDSQYKITSAIVADEWTPKQLESRQKWMARQACGVWKINL